MNNDKKDKMLEEIYEEIYCELLKEALRICFIEELEKAFDNIRQENKKEDN